MRFRSGRVGLDVKYSDRGEYTMKITTPEGKRTMRTRPPASTSHAADSREAMHDSAHAALSFAADEYERDHRKLDVAQYADTTDRGWHLVGG